MNILEKIDEYLEEAYSGDIAIKAKNYVKHLKNNTKEKEDAKAYYNWMIADKKGKEPKCNKSDKSNLDVIFQGGD